MPGRAIVEYFTFGNGRGQVSASLERVGVEASGVGDAVDCVEARRGR